jgi:hypothetical protein
VSLAAGGAFSAARGTTALIRSHRLKPLPLLVLICSLAGMLLSLASDDPRLMIAKDSLGNSVVCVVTLSPAYTPRSMMNQGIRPFFTRGNPRRLAAWDRISRHPRFPRRERKTTLVWVAMIIECLLRMSLPICCRSAPPCGYRQSC